MNFWVDNSSYFRLVEGKLLGEISDNPKIERIDRVNQILPTAGITIDELVSRGTEIFSSQQGRIKTFPEFYSIRLVEGEGSIGL